MAGRYNHPTNHEDDDMGRGDKRSFKGKIFKGSHGKTRPRNPPKAKAGAGGTKKK